MTVKVIAEIGVNHVGDPDYADEYVSCLIQTRVHAVTFQVHSPATTTTDPKDAEVLRGRQLPEDYYAKVFPRLKRAGIQVGVASTDYRSIGFFAEIKADFFKTLGADITCLPLFEEIAKTKLPVYISTAWASVEEIAQAVSVFKRRDRLRLIYTDGIAGAVGNTHLRVMEYLRQRFALPVAYGKHSTNTDILLAAIALRPESIFVYVKGERAVQHPDDAHAIPMAELPLLLDRIEALAKVLEEEPKENLGLEGPMPEKAQKQRRRLIAWRDIEEGEKFSNENVAAIRPYAELSASHYRKLLGRAARRAYKKGDTISSSELLS